MICNKVFEEKDYTAYADIVAELRAVADGLDADGIKGVSTGGVRIWECAHVSTCTWPKRGDVVLDIGSHKGLLPFYLRELGCITHAMDTHLPDQEFLDYADNRWIVYKEADIYDIPYPDRCFDKATSICLLEHLVEACAEDEFVDRIVSAIREVMRVLKPGGIFASTIDFYVRGFNTFRTFHRDLLYEIVEAVADVAEPCGELDYEIPDPWAYYLENSTVYPADDTRRHEHIKKLKQKILPDNLFTCAALVLQKR